MSRLKHHCDENEPNPEGKPELPDHEMDGDVIPWDPEGDGNGEGDDDGDGSSGDKSEDEGKAGKGPTPEQVQQRSMRIKNRSLKHSVLGCWLGLYLVISKSKSANCFAPTHGQSYSPT